MASTQAQLDAVKAAVSSVSTCSPATVATLKQLLLPKDEYQASDSTESRTTKTSRSVKTPASRTVGSKKLASSGGLSAKERGLLASHVVNAILRALGEASKLQSPSKPQCCGELVKTATRNALRRSNSTPLSPLQPRSLNRVSTSPIAAKTSRTPVVSSNNSLNCLAAIECARISFSVLRSLQSMAKVGLTDLQLEAGICSFIAKLITLGFHEQAVKELRILKPRLEGVNARKRSTAPATEAKKQAQLFAELLDFRGVLPSDPAFPLVITTQIHTLKLLSAIKKPTYIETTMSVIRDSHTSSPLKNVLSFANVPGADREKIVRQLESISQILLSMTPGVSTRDDGIATDARLSVSPVTALELQVLGLDMRLHWWQLAAHKGDVDKDILSPLSKCLLACSRRLASNGPAYESCRVAFSRIHEHIQSQGYQPSTSSKSALATIYQLLTSLAQQEPGKLSDAAYWAESLQNILDPAAESAGKCCSIATQLLALRLRLDPIGSLATPDLLSRVVTDIQGSLRGEATELDELLTNVSTLRKAAIAILLGHVKDKSGTPFQLTRSAQELLEAFVLQCPRFCLRWLGKPPIPKSSTKDYLRYEQRRQKLSESIRHTLDSAFLLAKTRLEERRQTWDSLDTILSDSLTLLGYMGDAYTADDSGSYFVKISHFYYLKYNSLRQQSPDPKDASALRALRQSIECVRNRSAKEKEKAQLLMKLERLAELCRVMGRSDEALAALQNIRTSLIEDGVLEGVTQGLTTRPPQVVWSSERNFELLSWALASIAKLETVWVNWAAHLPESEQAAVLEHRLLFHLLSSDRKAQHLTLDDPTVDALLRIYNPTKYPIRRLRTLLRILCVSVGSADLLPDIQSVTADAVQLEEHHNLGDDSSLAKYLKHMKTLYLSITTLVEGCPDMTALEGVMSEWRSIVVDQETRESLHERIDDIPELLAHLQSVADFLQTKGQDGMVVAVLDLAAQISRAAGGPRAEDYVDIHTNLALHYVSIGQSSKADLVLQSPGISSRFGTEVPGDILARYYLASTDCLISRGDIKRANERLLQAKEAFDADVSRSKASRTRRKLLFAYASFLYSFLSLARGDFHHALVYSRESVRVSYQEWARIESQFTGGKEPKKTPTTEITSFTASMIDQKNASGPTGSPASWKVFRLLVRCLWWLSTVYDHLGMYQETLYYAEQAEKLARTAQSVPHLTQCLTWLTSVYLKAGDIAKSLELANQVRELILTHGQSCAVATHACQISAVYRTLGDVDAGKEMVARAESVLASLMIQQPDTTDADQRQETESLEKRMAKLEIKDDKPTRRTRALTGTITRRKSPTATTAAKAKRTLVSNTPPVPVDVCLNTVSRSIIIQQALLLMQNKDWAGAEGILEAAKTRPHVLSDVPNICIALANCLIGKSLEDMAHDSVFSVVQDSTLSYPTILVPGSDKEGGDRERLSLTRQSPPPRTRGGAGPRRAETSRDRTTARYVESLRRAENCLDEAHEIAAVTGDATMLHRISSMLQSVNLLLSAIPTKEVVPWHAHHATSATDLARNLTWRRERKAVAQEKLGLGIGSDGNEWPSLVPPPDPKRPSLGFSLDLSKLQKDYVDILPKAWAVLSISLSENKRDLYITKMMAGHSPFIIRLPLERASSRDADNHVFNFQQGRSEMLEIIRLANESCRPGRDMSAKGAKSAWWAEREALDVRLRELLQLIERDWLGGFRGIFSQHQHRAQLLMKFQKTFDTILDKHLPSRRQVRGRRSKAALGPKVSLDRRILLLFIGLGDATAEDCDFDDELSDLLYFIVDILQFHGERNAYDEIDFDAMAIDTLDALRAYHAAKKAEGDSKSGVHTILVLDKALHTFPWESLPCMQGLAVSRVPSLACLRRLVLEQRALSSGASSATDNRPAATEVPSGHYISATSGTYILNPSEDLKTTEATFAKPLAEKLAPSTSWTGIVGRSPTEAEFERGLAEADLLLYFGHGSGAQYVRGRTVRRLNKCRATALLWGCSSAVLPDVGGYEPQGPVWNYLLAGCPAVVGTLWDVTDRDIDRLAGRTLEEWGLLAPGTFAEDNACKKRGKTEAPPHRRRGPSTAASLDSDGTDQKRSLVEALACAREEACRFRYLTAAAAVVYGIPVYIEK
ncbi:hypothetical protein VTK73DRAFT_7940 [Phialemonium thermophilum]|uniref:separase n=1 Tax=Phialemonium thermophilum TaxID=223376 RepID=A0ABR3WBH3_9PEZI